MTILHRPKPPSLSAIIDYWAEPDQEDRAVLPNLLSWFIGWGEPFCFACGWLPPLRTDKAWAEKDVSQWLDLAHLIDHALGGSSEPSNLVPLCIFCHDAMPSFSERTPALEWILGRESKMPNPRIWQLFTDACPLIGRQHRNYRMQKMRGNYLHALLTISETPQRLGDHSVPAIGLELAGGAAVRAAGHAREMASA